jgi:hypothetical protein
VTDGYAAEPAEVDALIDALVGARDPGETPEAWWMHLSSRLALLAAAARTVEGLRDDLVLSLVSESTERAVAARLGLSPTRPGQMARRALKRRTP